MYAWDMVRREINSRLAELDNILSFVCFETGYYREEVLSKSRDKELMKSKHIFNFIASKHSYDFSPQEIADYIGRDRTTVLHSLKTTSGEIDVNPNFANYINELLSKFYGDLKATKPFTVENQKLSDLKGQIIELNKKLADQEKIIAALESLVKNYELTSEVDQKELNALREFHKQHYKPVR